MTDKDLRRLSRAELLDILYEQRKRYEDSLAAVSYTHLRAHET